MQRFNPGLKPRQLNPEPSQNYKEKYEAKPKFPGGGGGGGGVEG